MAEQRYTLDDLLTLMRVLRDEQYGCPWDVEQSWDTIVPHTLEEAYEVADAIERRAYDELPKELGDLLFQVVYYARFAEEEGRFDLYDVIHILTAKMVSRHPHVFPDGYLASRREGVPARSLTQADVSRMWEARKRDERDERAEQTRASQLDDIPVGLPALSRSQKLSKRASQVGFDWPDHRGVIEKVHEELAEVEEAIEQGDSAAIKDELGDLLFITASLCRHFDIDAEDALRQGNRKFERRFRAMEPALNAEGDRDPERLDRIWADAKARIYAEG
ncbi:nucleoside triphosphate pyrophosphohydrolase [Zymobacter palmae]|uniref:Predicted pyrophosphatase n=1 Tax=Zymobacter palmae TaxID=33074 RepID=A0A348HG88_9GAMM|nr:nucleoside triphosphate pyrophosphohydrolase [Zymobacter palmae]BBG30640.1 predicted pyrophosphatase [Zymobacter palmae]